MSQKTAKKLRQIAFGTTSRHDRKYVKGREPQAAAFINALSFYKNPTCICDGTRRAYRDLKHAIRRNKALWEFVSTLGGVPFTVGRKGNAVVVGVTA